MKTETLKTFLWITLFGIAMGFLETSVVVYLRELYYPEGFNFPLNPIGEGIALVEILREAATMIMLLMIAFMVGKNAIERLAWFIFSFAIWDIFYYVFLYLLIDWPQTIMEWDILFLIPVTWVGPVICPVINSIMMIVLAGLLVHFSKKNKTVTVGGVGWFLLIVGSVVVIVAYTLDYVTYMQQWFSLGQIFSMGNSADLLAKATEYVPRSFNWYIFTLGILMHLLALVGIYNKNK